MRTLNFLTVTLAVVFFVSGSLTGCGSDNKGKKAEFRNRSGNAARGGAGQKPATNANGQSTDGSDQKDDKDKKGEETTKDSNETADADKAGKTEKKDNAKVVKANSLRGINQECQIADAKSDLRCKAVLALITDAGAEVQKDGEKVYEQSTQVIQPQLTGDQNGFLAKYEQKKIATAAQSNQHQILVITSGALEDAAKGLNAHVVLVTDLNKFDVTAELDKLGLKSQQVLDVITDIDALKNSQETQAVATRARLEEKVKSLTGQDNVAITVTLSREGLVAHAAYLTKIANSTVLPLVYQITTGRGKIEITKVALKIDSATVNLTQSTDYAVVEITAAPKGAYVDLNESTLEKSTDEAFTVTIEGNGQAEKKD